MRKSPTLLLVLVFLTASCLTVAKPVSSADDIAEDTWVEKTSMPTARCGLGVVVVEGKIYAIGGSSTAPFNNQAENLLSINEEYDPTTDSWTVKPSMPTPRAYFAIAAFQNKIYCIGGVVGSEKLVDSGGFTHSLFVYSGINEVYDTITETWETKASMPIDISRFQANVVDGKIYAIGSQFTYVYDPAADSWTEKTPFPGKVSDAWWIPPVSSAVGDQIFFTGEFRTGQRLFIYNTLNDSWSEIAHGAFEAGIGVGATIGVRAPARVYVLGLTNWGYDQVNQAYDPDTDNWTTATPNPLDQRNFGCVVLNDVLYVVGGYVDSETVTDANQAYLPIGFSPLPEISVLSPLTQTYNGSSVSLNFTVDRPVSWMSYSLDGADNVTVSGNLTLTGLSGGMHNVTVYANDTYGNMGASETIFFTIEPFPTALVIASVITVTVVGIGL
ncbi:hypothetical protein JW988_07535, partial [Candidatus Bathyarchaeota archaeon]|nr:hypothetical protein [Candidatus Bathyarchaeota archaeon]